MLFFKCTLHKICASKFALLSCSSYDPVRQYWLELPDARLWSGTSGLWRQLRVSAEPRPKEFHDDHRDNGGLSVDLYSF